jgi:hypothetical protein
LAKVTGFFACSGGANDGLRWRRLLRPDRANAERRAQDEQDRQHLSFVHQPFLVLIRSGPF